ncbi:hypothetical protein ACIXT9_02365 [Bacteroides fragilis]
MSIKRFILDSLKTKFTGIDEKVLSRIAATAVKTVKNEEEAKTYVEELTLQQVIDSYSDSRATDAQEKAVKSYEEKFGLKDGKKADSTEEPGGEGGEGGNGEGAGNGKKGGEGEGGEKMPDYVKALFGKIDTLTNELTTLKAGKVADTRKSTLDALLKDAPEKVRNNYTRNFNRMQFKDDADFNEWIEEISPEIEEATESQSASEGVVSRPKGGAKAGEDTKVNPYVQARVDARKAETATPAIIGLSETGK